MKITDGASKEAAELKQANALEALLENRFMIRVSLSSNGWEARANS
jgi:hypothetical protein